jgi:predicted ATPase
MNSAEFSHLYALREELRNYRFLQLDPASLRRPSSFTAGERLEPDGINLASVLARIQAETRSDTQPQGALADITADLSALIPGAVGLTVNEDRQTREYRVGLRLRDEAPYSARVVSDGTLRLLALLTALHDPRYRGLICLEEPENGVHPRRLNVLLEKLRSLVTRPAEEEVDPTRPLAQMLLNSHSPVVLSALRSTEALVLFADLADIADPATRQVRRATRLRPVNRDLLAEPTRAVTEIDVQRFLETVDHGA